MTLPSFFAASIKAGVIASAAGAAATRTAKALRPSAPAPLSKSRFVSCLITASSNFLSASFLFDHFVGAGEQCRRYGEPERLGRLDINRQLKFYRRLHRQAVCARALENAVDVGRRAFELIRQIHSVRQEASIGGVKAIRANRRQPISRG